MKNGTFKMGLVFPLVIKMSCTNINTLFLTKIDIMLNSLQSGFIVYILISSIQQS